MESELFHTLTLAEAGASNSMDNIFQIAITINCIK